MPRSTLGVQSLVERMTLAGVRIQVKDWGWESLGDHAKKCNVYPGAPWMIRLHEGELVLTGERSGYRTPEGARANRKRGSMLGREGFNATLFPPHVPGRAKRFFVR